MIEYCIPVFYFYMGEGDSVQFKILEMAMCRCAHFFHWLVML